MPTPPAGIRAGSSRSRAGGGARLRAGTSATTAPSAPRSRAQGSCSRSSSRAFPTSPASPAGSRRDGCEPEVLYEDDFMVVVDKPARLASGARRQRDDERKGDPRAHPRRTLRRAPPRHGHLGRARLRQDEGGPEAPQPRLRRPHRTEDLHRAPRGPARGRGSASRARSHSRSRFTGSSARSSACCPSPKAAARPSPTTR